MIRRMPGTGAGYHAPVAPVPRGSERIFDHVEEFRSGRGTPVVLLLGLLVAVCAVWVVLLAL